MEEREDTPIYFVNDFEYGQSDTHSISTITSGSTDGSMSTLASEEASEYFQQIHGRVFPLAQSPPIFLPTDDVEVQRLDIQHTALKRVLNGNYYGPVKEVLSETGGRRKRVLDLLTAEGNWVREMAAEFPHVDFTSVDIIPLVPHAQSHNILGYEVYDLYNGIVEPDESFDLVHVRHLAPTIWDLATIVLEIYRVLRPGGLLIWSEFDAVPRDASVTDHNAAEKSPNIGRAWQLITDACTRKGANMDLWRDAPLLLDPQNEIWRNEEGTDNRAGFTSMQNAVKMLPLTSWHPSPHLRDAGVLIQQGARQTWAGFVPLFVSEGLSESEAEELVLKMCMETTELGTRQLYVSYHMLYAFKPVWRPGVAYSKGTNNASTVVET
ncbi:S-adenosyl-L-methionine-dependent methyltransferase [Ceratobasidium sp. AG-I]|nr:S-adenosyl-L-methionine-dependent methyltransferase [Ceratobasidium sp. AG-I]